MHCLKLNLICSRVAIGTLNRGFQTYSVLAARKREKVKVQREPGLSYIKSSFKEDEEFLKGVDDENDLENLEETDFFEEPLNDSKRDAWKRELLGRKIAKHKFFKPKPQPPMLSWVEREYMKYLHKTDPVEWDIRTLSESFPATPDIVKKILRVKWKVTPKLKEKMDQKVQENWELLSKGKLEADPAFIEHCKKFVNCRQVIIENAKKQGFYLPELKEKKKYNGGEMSSILEHYEKTINRLLEENQKLLTDKKETENNNNSSYNKSSLELLHEKIEEEREVRDLEGKDSFRLNKFAKNKKREITFDALKKNIIKKADEGENLNILEKAILESKLSEIVNKNKNAEPKAMENEFRNTTGAHLSEESEYKKHKSSYNSSINAEKKLLDQSDYEDSSSEMPYVEKTKQFKAENLGKFLQFTENSVLFNIENEEEKTESKKAKKKLKKRKSLSTENDLTSEEGTNNEKVALDSTSDPEEFYNNIDTKTNKSIETDSAMLPSSTQSFEQTCAGEKEVNLVLQNSDTEGNCEDRVLLLVENKGSISDAPEKEAETIKNTAPEMQRKINTNLQTGVLFEDYYPERITIPKEKKKLGSLFKVKDCYYDINGKFLYRVPGITK